MELKYEWVNSEQEPARHRLCPLLSAPHISAAALDVIRASERPKLVTTGSDSQFAKLGLVVLTADEFKQLLEK